MSEARTIIDALDGLGVRLSEREGKLVGRGPRAVLDYELVAKLKAAKEPLLQELRRTAADWRKDASGRLILADGTIYAPTKTGGWILVKHPTKRMREPGTVEVAQTTKDCARDIPDRRDVCNVDPTDPMRQIGPNCAVQPQRSVA